jgi:hypothetical protein
MTRGLDLDFEDATHEPGGNLVHFVKFSVVPAPNLNDATLSKVVNGLQGWKDFANDLTDLGDFSGSALAHSTLVPGTGISTETLAHVLCSRLELHYDWPEVPDVRGMYVQGILVRTYQEMAGPSFMPGFSVGGAGIERRVTGIGSTYPTVERQISSSLDGGDSDLSRFPNTQPFALDFNRRANSGYSYPDGSILDFGRINIAAPTDGKIGATYRSWRRPDGGGDCDPCAGEGPACQYGYVDEVQWRGVAAMNSDVVCITNVPEGYIAQISGSPGVFPLMERGGAAFATTDEFGGGGIKFSQFDGDSLFIYGNGLIFPLQTLSVQPSGGGPLFNISPPEGIWGGDCYTFTYDQSTTPNAQYVTSDMDLTWDGLDWIGTGREGLAFQAIQETGDTKAQGIRFQLPAVNLAQAVSVLKSTRHRGGIVEVWAAKYDESLGTLLSEPQPIFYGYSQGGFEVTESAGADGAAGGAVVEAHIASRLAVLRRRAGILANEIAHQQHFPGDTFFRGRENLIGFEVPWGNEGSNAPVGGSGSSGSSAGGGGGGPSTVGP